MIQTTEALPGIIEALPEGLILTDIAILGYVAWQARKFSSSGHINRANTFSAERTARIAGYAEQTVDYVQQNRIGAVALIDGAARPFAQPFSMAWHQRFDGQENAPARPPIFFVNPQGFEPHSKKDLFSTMLSMGVTFFKGNHLESPLKRRKAEDIVASLPEQFPGLYELRDQPLLLFDGCVHSGQTVAPLIERLEEAGFKNIYFGVAYCKDPDKVNSKKPDLMLDTKIPNGACYPFGVDRMTEKTYKTPFSQVSAKTKRRVLGESLRTSLKEALVKHYDASESKNT